MVLKFLDRGPHLSFRNPSRATRINNNKFMKENFAVSQQCMVVLLLSTVNSYYVIAIVGSLDIFKKILLNDKSIEFSF